MIVLAYLLAILLPLLFLYIIYAQDLYGQGRFGYILLAFGWGLAAFGASYGLNLLIGDALFPLLGLPSPRSRWSGGQSLVWMVVLVAPVVEEVLKSLVLLLLSRRMTYFVDGALYGFAAGIAFSILENVLIYLPHARGEGAGWLALMRAFSTCLMHGSASALVGTAIGRFRYGHGGRRALSLVLGWGAAILLHMGFNRLSYTAVPGLGILLGALGIGIGGGVLIIFFIRWGLAEEKRWLGETLGLGVGVTQKEVSLVQRYEQIDGLLEPVWERFGFEEEKLEQVAAFLLKQGQLGIKRKARSMTTDLAEQGRLDEEISGLQEEMERIRRQVGTYIMMCVRSILPPEVVLDFAALAERLVDREAFREGGGEALDDRLRSRIAEREGQERPAGGTLSLWNRLGQEQSSEEE